MYLKALFYPVVSHEAAEASAAAVKLTAVFDYRPHHQGPEKVNFT